MSEPSLPAHPDVDPTESRVGTDAVQVLRHSAWVQSAVRLISAVSIPVVLIVSATVPGLRDYATIPIVAWFIVLIAAIVVSARWAARQQMEASHLATNFIGLRTPAPPIPASVIRGGPRNIDAWFAVNGVTNPVTGLVPPPIGPNRPPFNDTMRVPTRIGIVMMFVGLGLLAPWAVALITASIESSQLSPLLSVGLLVAAFGLIAAGIIVILIASRRRLLARLAWAQANRVGDQP